MGKLLKSLNVFCYGMSSISLCAKRNYYRRIPKTSLPTTYERWEEIGNRLKNATRKVVGQTGK